MKNTFLLLSLLFCTLNTVSAQDNVAEIAHAFIKAVKTNDLSVIKGRYLDVKSAYAILPKESTGMNAVQKNETFIKPLYKRFSENFEKIQDQIKNGNIDVRKIDLVSYKLEKIDLKAAEAQGKQKLPQAMSLFFNYKKKEHIIPISVVEIDERWYILEILYTTDLFK